MILKALFEFIEDMLILIGACILLLILFIGVMIAFHFYPIITSIIGGLIVFGCVGALLETILTKRQLELTSEWFAYTIAAGLLLTAIGFAFYYFTKTTAVICAFILLGLIVEQVEKHKATKATS
ncbi:hypothetical protein ACUXZ4_05865 [Pasteurellaceae bacterium 22721_9_1]